MVPSFLNCVLDVIMDDRRRHRDKSRRVEMWSIVHVRRNDLRSSADCRMEDSRGSANKKPAAQFRLSNVAQSVASCCPVCIAIRSLVREYA